MATCQLPDMEYITAIDQVYQKISNQEVEESGADINGLLILIPLNPTSKKLKYIPSGNLKPTKADHLYSRQGGSYGDDGLTRLPM